MPPAPHPPRRAALGLGLSALAGAVLGGCGIRLEEGAPRIPGIPTRTPLPRESDLLAVVRGCRSLAADATRLGGDCAVFAAAFDRQASVLADAVRRLGVPEVLVTAGPSPAAGDAPSTRDDVVGRLIADAEPAVWLPDAPATLRLSLLSVTAQRRAAAVRLGGRVQSPVLATWSGPDPATLLAALRASTYAAEVAAARAAGADRASAASTVAVLRGMRDEVAGWAGEDGPSVDTDHRLPVPEDTPSFTRAIVAAEVPVLRARFGELLGVLAGRPAAPETAAVLDGLARVEVEAQRWGSAPEAFPGLT